MKKKSIKFNKRNLTQIFQICHLKFIKVENCSPSFHFSPSFIKGIKESLLYIVVS